MNILKYPSYVVLNSSLIMINNNDVPPQSSTQSPNTLTCPSQPPHHKLNILHSPSRPPLPLFSMTSPVQPPPRRHIYVPPQRKQNYDKRGVGNNM